MLGLKLNHVSKRGHWKSIELYTMNPCIHANTLIPHIKNNLWKGNAQMKCSCSDMITCDHGYVCFSWSYSNCLIYKLNTFTLIKLVVIDNVFLITWNYQSDTVLHRSDQIYLIAHTYDIILQHDLTDQIMGIVSISRRGLAIIGIPIIKMRRFQIKIAVSSWLGVWPMQFAIKYVGISCKISYGPKQKRALVLYFVP